MCFMVMVNRQPSTFGWRVATYSTEPLLLLFHSRVLFGFQSVMASDVRPMGINSPTFFIVSLVGLYPLTAASLTLGKLVDSRTLPTIVEL
jgi:hypothetical protein